MYACRRLAVVLALVAAALVPGPQASAAALSDRGFFGKWAGTEWEYGPRLDYRIPGLAEVGTAAKAGDYALAAQRLLEYCRSRPAIDAGGFSRRSFPGALELTPSHIWTLGSGEVYVETVSVGRTPTTVTADVTGIINSGKSGFFLMSRLKDMVTAYFNTGENATGKPTLRLTLADGSVKTLYATHDTYISAGAPGTVHGAGTLMAVADRGPGPFSSATRKAYLQFDLGGGTKVTKAELTLTGRALTRKSVMLYGNGAIFDETTRTWSNTVQNTYSWQGDPGGFDWKRPAGADKEYLYQLPRFYFAGPLALEYQKTGDEYYARTLIGLMTDFIKDADTYDSDEGAGSYLGNIHVANRVHNWLAAYEILRKSPSLTAEANVAILKTLNRAGVYLHTAVNGSPNQMQAQKTTLLHAAVYFPEFRVARKWRANAIEYLSADLGDATHPDGGYKEATSGYLRAYALQYVKVVEFMQRNGIEFTATGKLRELAHFMMDQVYPNGYAAAYGDGDYHDQRSTLKALGDLLRDPELRYAGNAPGREPAHTSALYPDTRVAVSRSGWTAADSYLRLNADRGNHSHPDELAVTAYAYGRPLLADMGTFSYSDDARAVWLRRTTEAHNTIEVDDKAQDSTAAGAVSLVANPVFHLIGGYTDGSAGARHERAVLTLPSGGWLVSDRLTPHDTQTHRYEQNWHFTSGANPALRPGTEAVTTAFGTGANISVVPADAAQLASSLRDGYYSPKNYSVENATYASYVKSAAGQTTFDTLLLPSQGSADTSATVERLAVGTAPPGRATALKVGAAVYYKSWAAKASRTFGSYAFDGNVLYADAGSVLMVGGTSVVRAGTTVVQSPTEIGDLAVRFGRDGTLRIDGTSLTPRTDTAQAIAIEAPAATKVLLNGAQVPFERVGSLVYAAAVS